MVADDPVDGDLGPPGRDARRNGSGKHQDTSRTVKEALDCGPT